VSDGALFLVFSAMFMIPFIVLGLRMALAQHRYLNLYRQAHPTIKLPENSSDPFVFFSQIGRTGNSINAYFEAQEDPDLEKVRQEVTKRIQLAFTWGFGVPIVFFIVVAVFGL
jgi:hypothetical protein